jgi:hypothetical protein
MSLGRAVVDEPFRPVTVDTTAPQFGREGVERFRVNCAYLVEPISGSTWFSKFRW